MQAYEELERKVDPFSKVTIIQLYIFKLVTLSLLLLPTTRIYML